MRLPSSRYGNVSRSRLLLLRPVVAMPLLFFRVRVASGFREERLLAASGDSSFSLRSVAVVVDLCITVLRRRRKRNCLSYVRVLWYSTSVGAGGENAIVPARLLLPPRPLISLPAFDGGGLVGWWGCPFKALFLHP